MPRLILELSDAELADIAQRATALGLPVAGYVRKVLKLKQRKVGRPAKKAAKHG